MRSRRSRHFGRDSRQVASAAMAIISVARSILRGRPPKRPRARAAASPPWCARQSARARTRQTQRRCRTTRRPLAVVVSICAPAPVRTFKPTPRVRRSSTVLTRWRRSRPSRSSFQRHKRVAGLERLEACRQAGAIVPAARGQVLIDPGGINTGGKHRVALRHQRLGAVGLRDTDVADQHREHRQER